MLKEAENGRHLGHSKERLHTLIAYVEDKPGVLNRVTALFRRRAVNIDSLTVGRTETPGVSRMTIVLHADDTATRLVEANLYKQVNVLRVQDVTDVPAVSRELAFIKVRADAESRPKVLQVADVFRARVVDLSPGAVVIETTGTGDKQYALIEVLRPFGIIEMVRAGSTAITRGADAHDFRNGEAERSEAS